MHVSPFSQCPNLLPGSFRTVKFVTSDLPIFVCFLDKSRSVAETVL